MTISRTRPVRRVTAVLALAFVLSSLAGAAASADGSRRGAPQGDSARHDSAHPVAGPSCGASIPKPTGGTWTCTFADEFSGSALDTTKWVPQETSASGFGSKECYVNAPDNVAVAGGTLRLTVRKEDQTLACPSPSGARRNTPYTAGSVSTWSKFAQAYGRFEVRAKFPSATVAGLQSSLWLWPVNALKYGAWPRSGEIDIAETYSVLADRAIPYVHYSPSGVDPNVTNNYCMISNLAAFHTYTAEWTPSTITISYDGKTCLVDNWKPAGLVKPAPFDQPFMVALTSALGVGANAFDPASTPLPATTQIDYVHVWS